jgi:glycosyltransferase involved in cell wall biosynthesis
MIDVLMATYNGEKFIREQIDSLLAQSFTDWQLLVRDDGSTDKTVDICRRYALAHPHRIRLVEDAFGNQGVVGNFGRLLAVSQSEYVMFCDQDDVWLPEKIELTHGAMKRAESNLGPQTPMAVYTDLKIVDSNLSLVSDSLFRHLRRNPHVNNRLSRLCMATPAYGCTMMINQPLKNICPGFPPGVELWDLWLAMAAAAFGSLEYLDQPTILYRRHGGSQSGTRKFGLAKLFRGKSTFQFHRHHVYYLLAQHKVFYETFVGRLNSRQRKILADIASLPSRNWVVRRYLVLRHGLFKTGLVKNVGLLIVV